jgi:predicted transcriptional regulator
VRHVWLISKYNRKEVRQYRTSFFFLYCIGRRIELEQLSKSEKQIMNSFWNSTSPLTANDLLSVCIGRTWKTRSVFPLVKKLLEKGFLSEVGFVRCGKTYARTFRPAISRVEYWAEIIKQEDMDGDQLSELTDLLAQHKRSLDLA